MPVYRSGIVEKKWQSDNLGKRLKFRIIVSVAVSLLQLGFFSFKFGEAVFVCIIPGSQVLRMQTI